MWTATVNGWEDMWSVTFWPVTLIMQMRWGFGLESISRQRGPVWIIYSLANRFVFHVIDVIDVLETVFLFFDLSIWMISRWGSIGIIFGICLGFERILRPRPAESCRFFWDPLRRFFRDSLRLHWDRFKGLTKFGDSLGSIEGSFEDLFKLLAEFQDSLGILWGSIGIPSKV